MRGSLARMLDSTRTVAAASLLTLALGYFFIFVWAPHPWSWQGIDAYHELAKALARGEPFQTTDVPWGYAYYAAFFYWLFGERIWIPLVVQATLNGAVPFLLYWLVEPLAGRRVAVLAALIAGVFSFNTIYASTQSSDTICTVLFLTGLLCFASGVRAAHLGAFAASGVLFGLVPQFRPNMVLFPGVMIAAYLALPPRRRGKIREMAVFGVLVAALQMPWIVRNYQLTGLLLPTSTHGGVQLWYGTLQVGPYLESRAHNPRWVFESPAFDYTSLPDRPILIEAVHERCAAGAPPTTLVYWTDRDAAHRRVPPRPGWDTGSRAAFEVPPQPMPTALYYYFEQAVAPQAITSPPEGARNPYVTFVDDAHLGDLDRHGDVLDAFDLARLLQHIAWAEPLSNRDRLDLNGSGAVDRGDIDAALSLLVPDLLRSTPGRPAEVSVEADAVRATWPDRSSWVVRRNFGNNLADIDVTLDGEMAAALVSRRRTFASITYPPRRLPPAECVPADEVRVNAPFNWREPHMMNRYMALAADNISRDPGGFVAASLYRMMRLFIVYGTDDRATSQQFRGSGLVYTVGFIASIAYLAVFLAGVIVAARRRSALLLFLIPIVYVPVTICFVLTNMRYTVTVQPLMFAFVALAAIASLRLDATVGPIAGSSDR